MAEEKPGTWRPEAEELLLEEFSGGLNESCPPDKVPATDFMVFQNARISPDGKTIETRPGLSPASVPSAFQGKRILGIQGLDQPSGFSLLACLEDEIWLKSPTDWTKIFSPTKKAEFPVSICQYEGLTFIGGYEKPIAVLNGQAFYAGIEAPQTAPNVKAVASSAESLLFSHEEGNQDRLGELRSVSAQLLLAQSFKVGQTTELHKVALKLKKRGSPSGSLWVEIHSGTAGTSLTKNSSTAIVGQATADLSVSSLTSAFATYEINFTGTKPALIQYATYYLVVYGDFSASAANHVVVGFDSSSPAYAYGRYWTVNDSLTWSENINADLVFEVYGPGQASGEILSFGAAQTGDYMPLRSNYQFTELAQSFKLAGIAQVSSVRVAVCKKCDGGSCPTGSLWAEIHSSTVGTSHAKGASAAIVGGPSDDVYLSSIGEDYDWITLPFSGMKPELSAGTTYYLVLYGSFDVDSLKYVRWSLQTGYGAGSSFEINDGLAWTAPGPADHSFKIYGSLTAVVKVAEYSFASLDDYRGLRETAAQTLLAQGFIAGAECDLSSVKLYLSRVGTPTGNLWVEIHSSQSETSAAKGDSTGIVGEASANVDVSTLDAFPTYSLKSFVFSGTKPSLTKGNVYYLVVYGDYAVSGANYALVGMDRDAPTVEGALWEIDGSLVWADRPGADLIFYLYQTAVAMEGEYSYVVTFYRGGDWPCESNPSPASTLVTVGENQAVELTGIPVSPDPKVTARRLYRTTAGGAVRYMVLEIPDTTTTTCQDGAHDDALGVEASYDNGAPPAGDWIEVWDGRLWISGVPGYEEFVFLSGAGTPEQFANLGFIPLRGKESGRIVAIREFDNDLYAFKTNAVWTIVRSGESAYLPDRVVESIGLGAPGSLALCTKSLLAFLTNYGQIGLLAAAGATLPAVFDKASRTLSSLNEETMKKATADVYVPRNEYRLAIPTGGASDPNVIIAFNFLTQTFALDSHNLLGVSLIKTANRDSPGRKTFYGSSGGELLFVDEDAGDDAGVSFSTDARTGWFPIPRRKRLRRVFTDIICPTGSSVLFRVYRDMSAAAYEKSIMGSQPPVPGGEMRATIRTRHDLNVHGKFFSFRLTATSPGKVRLSRLHAIFKDKAMRGSVKAR